MKRFTITVSDSLFAAAEFLRKRRRYRSLSEYVQGLIRYDGQTQKEHHLTAEWAALTGYERDRLDAAIVRSVETGEGVHGSWLLNRIEAIVKTHIETNGTAPEPKAVAEQLAREISEPS